MDYVQKRIEEIKEDWFKNHQAITEKAGDATIIYFKEPRNFMYGTKYVLHDNNIFISGDIGEAVYNLTCEATLENIKSFDVHYLTSKLVAHVGDRWDFDGRVAKAQLDEHYATYEMEKDNVYDSLVEAIEESGSLDHFRARLMVVYETTSATSDLMSDVWELGMELPNRFIAYWVGLQIIAGKEVSK